MKKENFYDNDANNYDAERFSNKAGLWSDKEQKKTLLKILGPLNGLNVLELGSGTGRITEVLCESGAKVVGVDESAPMLEMARKRLSNYLDDGRCEFRISSIENELSKTATFDLVVMVNVFGHLEHPLEVVKLAATNLREGGAFVFNFPNIISPYLPAGLLVNARKKSIVRAVGSKWYDMSSVEKILGQADLRVRRVEGNFYVPLAGYLFPLLPMIKVASGIVGTIGTMWYPSCFIRAEK